MIKSFLFTRRRQLLAFFLLGCYILQLTTHCDILFISAVKFTSTTSNAQLIFDYRKLENCNFISLQSQVKAEGFRNDIFSYSFSHGRSHWLFVSRALCVTHVDSKNQTETSNSWEIGRLNSFTISLLKKTLKRIQITSRLSHRQFFFFYLSMSCCYCSVFCLTLLTQKQSSGEQA